MGNPKVLLVAGHNNERDLTAEGMCPGRDVDALTRSTGASGEAAWTGDAAQRIADALAATRAVDARVTDAVYHRDLFTDWKPDLVLAVHYHRGPVGTRAFASAPDPQGGYHAAAASAESQRFVARFAGGYEKATGIPVTQGAVTDNMTELYTWCFIDESSQAVIIEFGDANEDQDRVGLYEPAIARIARFIRDCVLEHFNVSYNTALDQPKRRASDRTSPPYYVGQSADVTIKAGETATLDAIFAKADGTTEHRTVAVKAYDPGRYVVITRPVDADGNEVLDQRPDATHVVDVSPAT